MVEAGRNLFLTQFHLIQTKVSSFQGWRQNQIHFVRQMEILRKKFCHYCSISNSYSPNKRLEMDAAKTCRAPHP